MIDSKNKITLEKLRHTAHLARIKLTPTEEKTFLFQLSDILNYFNILKKINTKGVKPSFQIVDQIQPFHPDKITPSLSIDQALSSASKRSDNYFQVKSTISK